MATTLQIRRGTNTQHGSFTGAAGEITVNTTNNSIHVHDNSTAGGFELARANVSNVSNPQFSGTSSLLVPNGTTAQRPGSPANGQIRYNTTTGALEAYVAGAWGNVGIGSTLPSGSILAYTLSTAPTGFLLCNGAAVSRTTYSALFAVIGTDYGTGDGSSTFNVPDLRGRVIAGLGGGTGGSSLLTNQSGGLNGDTMRDTGGAETHTLTEAQLASHKHAQLKEYPQEDESNTNVETGIRLNTGVDSTTQVYLTVNNEGDDIIQAAGSDSPHNNVQPTIILTWCIKT
ncbi:MAG: tail fiber protein [Betaproteobacteria bacterium]